MNILAFDTATEVLSIALRTAPESETDTPRAGRPVPRPYIYTETRDNGLKHSRMLMPLVGRILDDAAVRLQDVDLVACTRGPGSFTGLRIGMATAKGLAAAIASARKLEEPPIVSVSTLDVMAHALSAGQSAVVPVIDGRKNRFYAAIFRAGIRLTTDLDLAATEIMHRIDQNSPSPPAGSPNGPLGPQPGSVLITGPHADLFASRLDDPSRIVVDPAFRRGHAESLIPLAAAAYQKHGPDAPGQGPVYVRSSDAELVGPILPECLSSDLECPSSGRGPGTESP
ncbi:MAG: tRNA (adenosine(37)-N6)-threonylcarbamoyltransferase complex dimerization subunit type 1 TsaB [Spirochaetales bacterium]|nr:tRNA (adenosine(37)-N6)-threonylcarbamoyltransferase complex dimerization subunit type 1 TsaB [Spirochaetales bacterium]